MEREMRLEIEELEERIAPSFVLDPTTTPGQHADPVGGQGGNTASFGPDSTLHPNKAAWTAHGNRAASGLPGSPVGSPVLDNGFNV